jgi:hypothetical protein
MSLLTKTFLSALSAVNKPNLSRRVRRVRRVKNPLFNSTLFATALPKTHSSSQSAAVC